MSHRIRPYAKSHHRRPRQRQQIFHRFPPFLPNQHPQDKTPCRSYGVQNKVIMGQITSQYHQHQVPTVPSFQPKAFFCNLQVYITACRHHKSKQRIHSKPNSGIHKTAGQSVYTHRHQRRRLPSQVFPYHFIYHHKR